MNRNKGGRPALRLKAKGVLGRGGDEAKQIFDAMVNNWDELQEALDNLEENDRDAIKEHFNKCVDGEDDLGEILFGDVKDF